MSTIDARHWIVDLISGGSVGAASGVIAAVNLVIIAGVERGYEARFDEIFAHSVVLGVSVVVLLVAGPVAGVLVARCQRTRVARTKATRS